MRAKRAEASRIYIPEIKDPIRREKCLDDPHRFLRTYFPDQFFRPFERIHDHMIEAVIQRAKYGGKKSVAAPRSIGKSETVKGMIPYVIAKGWIRFPVIIAASNSLAKRAYNDFRKKCTKAGPFVEDFPEICYPFIALDGAAQRAARQHVDFRPTDVVFSADDYLQIADIEGSLYSRVKLAFAGLDQAIRGLNIEGDRPDLLVIDDPETRESARSETQIEARCEMIDKDLEGLGVAGASKPLAMVMLSTIQNTFCASYMYTDFSQKPSWSPVRYGMFESWPDCCRIHLSEEQHRKLEQEAELRKQPLPADLWEEYITLRKIDQSNGDPYGLNAVRFYRKNRKQMDAGAKMLVSHFEPQVLEDGTQVTISLIQAQFNRIADTSIEAYLTEFQNDPPEELGPEKLPLTMGRVLQQTSGMERGVCPEDCDCTTIGIDVGKSVHHWTKMAWQQHADEITGSIVDYGIIQTTGLTTSSSDKAIEAAVQDALQQFIDEDPVFRESPPVLTLIDSGYVPDAIYELCQRNGKTFKPARGRDSNRFRIPKKTKDTAPFFEAYAQRIEDPVKRGRKLWIYHINVEYWKHWLQQRLMVDPFRDATRVPGSVALFEPPSGDAKIHRSFARHMVSEGLEMISRDDKADKPTWIVRDPRNNHWLDSTGYACAAAGCVGIRAVRPIPEKPKPVKLDERNEEPQIRQRDSYLISRRRRK